MSKYLETLPQYHFDRDDFCKVFTDIDVMCGYPQNTENFLLYRWEDEFYIIHRDTGISIWDEPTPEGGIVMQLAEKQELVRLQKPTFSWTTTTISG